MGTMGIVNWKRCPVPLVILISIPSLKIKLFHGIGDTFFFFFFSWNGSVTGDIFVIGKK